MTNSDLKKSKSTPTSRSTLPQEKYVLELETEKANLLEQVANYEQEQKASVKIYDDQEKLIDEKEKQLISKDEELIEKEKAIEKLKARIHQLFKDKKSPPNSKSEEEEIINLSQTNTETQTILDFSSLAEMETQIQAFQRFGKLCGEENIDEWEKRIRKFIADRNKLFGEFCDLKTSNEILEQQLSARQLQNLKDFETYQEQLQEKETEITQLTNQNSLYQQQIRKLILEPNQNRNKLFILTILLIITASLLLFK